MSNPVLIELTRGSLRESAHAGALAVVAVDGRHVGSLGDVVTPIFPRSAIKPIQAVPLLETGAAKRFRFDAAEIALACASHTGTPRHVAIATSMLSCAGLTPADLACGVHEPTDPAAARELARAAQNATPLHHNCSGKHAGMLATAVHQKEPIADYWRPEHPVQVRVRQVLEDLTGTSFTFATLGIDGCSVPNWAIPLERLALVFAKFTTGVGLSNARAATCRRIVEACWAEPQIIAGPSRMNTKLMELLPGRVMLKGGAEGVYAGALPEHGLGFALKIDDGGKRASDIAALELIGCFYPEARKLADPVRRNWRGLEVGRIEITPVLAELLTGLR